MRESAFWANHVRPALSRDGAVAVRIEDKLNKGVPDVVATYRGRTFWLELKTDSTLSSEQVAWHCRWRDGGGHAFVLWCDDDIAQIETIDSENGLRFRWFIRPYRNVKEQLLPVIIGLIEEDECAARSNG